MAAELLRAFDARGADLLILDVGLPDADGRDVCASLRARGKTVPVVFLTARDAVPERVAGFEAGGDDYVTKPFALDELAERVRALLRRTARSPGPRVRGPATRLGRARRPQRRRPRHAHADRVSPAEHAAQ